MNLYFCKNGREILTFCCNPLMTKIGWIGNLKVQFFIENESESTWDGSNPVTFSVAPSPACFTMSVGLGWSVWGVKPRVLENFSETHVPKLFPVSIKAIVSKCLYPTSKMHFIDKDGFLPNWTSSIEAEYVIVLIASSAKLSLTTAGGQGVENLGTTDSPGSPGLSSFLALF